MAMLCLLGLLAAGFIPLAETLQCHTCVDDDTEELFCPDGKVPNTSRQCPPPFTHCITMDGKDKDGDKLVYRECACYNNGGLEQCEVEIKEIAGWKGCAHWCATDLCNNHEVNSASRPINCRNLTVFCLLINFWTRY